ASASFIEGCLPGIGGSGGLRCETAPVRPLPSTITVRDVTLRDGLQDERPIDLAAKLAVFEALIDAGVRDLELTSFVRPDRVPAMADAAQLAAATHDGADDRGVVRWGLVLNRRGAQRALDASIDHLQFVVSVSDEHSRRNAGAGVAERLDDLATVVADAERSHAIVEVTLATAFGCPYQGPVAPSDVVAAARMAIDHGVRGIGLADTIGTGVPTEVAELVGEVTDIGAPAGVPVGVHLHDTRGLGVANALAAVDAGATRVDASLGGLGGCPFAPGASGNVSVEDVVHAFEEMGCRTGIDVARLIDAATIATGAVGRALDGHVALAGPRFATSRVPT
ncbi:MAG: hydroxymethylglutaryl-CoA lyase, partial [Actinomycetota bacterium]